MFDRPNWPSGRPATNSAKENGAENSRSGTNGVDLPPQSPADSAATPPTNFTADYVSANVEVWSRALAEFRDKPVSILEIGSMEGRSALFFLNYLPHSQVTCIDWFRSDERERRFDENTTPFSHRIRRLKAHSLAALLLLRREAKSFDVVYVDACHDREAVQLDSILAWAMLRKGGIMIWDDYRYRPHFAPGKRPQAAIDGFLLSHAGEFEAIHCDYQYIVRKSDDAKADLLPTLKEISTVDVREPDWQPRPEPSVESAPCGFVFVSAIDQNYAVPWSAMITSFRDHHPEVPARAYIVHYDLDEDHRTYLKRTGEAVGVAVEFVRIPSYPFLLFQTRRRSSLKRKGFMSPIAYAKAFVDRFLPQDLGRVILIDADMIIVGDMSELLRLQPSHPVAAVANIPRLHQHQFNSGLMLVDLALWRRIGISDIAERFLLQHSDALHSHDQHVLNLIIKNDWAKLDLKWNFMEDFHRFRERCNTYSKDEIRTARKNPIIIHYAVGTDKPWRSDSEHPKADLYRDYCKRIMTMRAGLKIVDPGKAKG